MSTYKSSAITSKFIFIRMVFFRKQCWYLLRKTGANFI